MTSESEGPAGIDRVEFWVRTNPGTRPGPLMKVASGGELARFLLALKVVLADRGSAPTLIFDESIPASAAPLPTRSACGSPGSHPACRWSRSRMRRR